MNDLPIQSGILVVDTCSLLDIIRICRQSSLGEHMCAELAAILRIRDFIDEQRVTIACPALVRQEWNSNIEQVTNDTQRETQKLFRHFNGILSISRTLGLLNGSNMSLSHISLVNELSLIAQHIIASCVEIQEEEATNKRALRRATNNIAPAKKGTIKDSIIYESALSYFGRAHNTTNARVFLTSNTIDFCKPNSRNQAKEPIDTELNELGVVLCTNWRHASGILCYSS